LCFRNRQAKALSSVLQSNSSAHIEDAIRCLEAPEATELAVCVDYLLFRLRRRQAALQTGA
jgi:hypothetical protein